MASANGSSTVTKAGCEASVLATATTANAGRGSAGRSIGGCGEARAVGYAQVSAGARAAGVAHTFACIVPFTTAAISEAASVMGLFADQLIVSRNATVLFSEEETPFWLGTTNEDTYQKSDGDCLSVGLLYTLLTNVKHPRPSPQRRTRAG